MLLTRHQTPGGARWALDGELLPRDFSLGFLLQLSAHSVTKLFGTLPRHGAATGPLLAPIEPDQEVWAAGVTYLRSREARASESEAKDVYERVYDAPRPELFFKAMGFRVQGDGMPIRIRTDGRWHVPEPELTLVLNREMQIVGHTLGNDVSSRDIEGENPLYLPQAKIFNGSCALGPGLLLDSTIDLTQLKIQCRIRRGPELVFQGETSTSRIRRPLTELAEYLGRELDFPRGALLMTGTGIVPPDEFTLAPGDSVEISSGGLQLVNPVEG